MRLDLELPGGASSAPRFEADTSGIELIQPEGSADASAITISRFAGLQLYFNFEFRR